MLWNFCEILTTKQRSPHIDFLGFINIYVGFTCILAYYLYVNSSIKCLIVLFLMMKIDPGN